MGWRRSLGQPTNTHTTSQWRNLGYSKVKEKKATAFSFSSSLLYFPFQVIFTQNDTQRRRRGANQKREKQFDNGASSDFSIVKSIEWNEEGNRSKKRRKKIIINRHLGFLSEWHHQKKGGGGWAERTIGFASIIFFVSPCCCVSLSIKQLVTNLLNDRERGGLRVCVRGQRLCVGMRRRSNNTTTTNFYFPAASEVEKTVSS